MWNFFAPPRGGGRFEARYRVYPVSFIEKQNAENGDKIFLPASALDRLAQLNIEYPMLFSLENHRNGKITHTGVLEFIAEEGTAYVPYWIMQNLLLEEGDIATLRSVTLPKGTFVKLQPHTTDFIDISNPKAVLETNLRNYSCLTQGDTICLPYNNKKYYINIVETRPEQAISVIETDCEVEFAAALDYVEPSRQPVDQPIDLSSGDEAGPSKAADESAEPKFQAFVGAGRRLDGKPSANPIRTVQPAPSTSKSSEANGSSNGTTKKKAGKQVFGGGNRLAEKKAAEQKPGAQKAAPRPAEKEKDTEQAPSFKAFQGKGRSLKG